MTGERNKILKYDFYNRNTANVARELIGKILVKKDPGDLDDSTDQDKPESCILRGTIIETEAYFGCDDPASHAYNGITPRSRIMFGKPGVAYIYFCYGMYHMLNIVTEKAGTAGAVLIRAIIPLEGLEIMMKRRKKSGTRDLVNGPGKLTCAYDINMKDNGRDLTEYDNGLHICEPDMQAEEIQVCRSTRIGISRGKEKLLRFYLKDFYN